MGENLVFNGINGATGAYLRAPMTLREAAELARGEPRESRLVAALKRWLELVTGDHLGPKEGIDPTDLSQTGWGVVFPQDADPAVRAALGELLDHRQAQAARRHERFYRDFSGESGYRPGEGKWDFLDRNEAGFGPADPDKVPYYLLLVGDPEAIPYSFQYQLDVEYAVGRLCFETPDEYAAYARAVVAAETAARADHTATADAVFFGVRNPDDQATQQSADFLVEPLAGIVEREYRDRPVRRLLGEQATKAGLAGLLAGGSPPALLFTASHGMAFPRDHRYQLPHQGAILCQDWPGPDAWGERPIPEDHYFAADDLGSDARLDGLIVFHFGCYGAGTTRVEGYAHRHRRDPGLVAPHDFVARLPQRLLGRGGALAVVAHVEQCWGYSYLGLEGGERLQTFESTLERLLGGHPVGSAMDYFGHRYAEISTALSAELKRLKYGKQVDERQLTRLWTAENDARSYVILGDPAVRVRPAGSRA